MRRLILIPLLLLIAAAHAATPTRPGLCPRLRSRFAREALGRLLRLAPEADAPPALVADVAARLERDTAGDVRGVVGAERLPRACPWHPARDRLRDDDETQRAVNPAHSRFTCGRCGKSFRTEHHLDRHFDARHTNATAGTDADICLADYCDILRCQPATPRDVAGYGASQQRALNDLLCASGGGPQQRRTVCQVPLAKLGTPSLTPHTPQMVLFACFPPDRDAVTAAVHEYYARALCDPISCNTVGSGEPWHHSKELRVVWIILVLIGTVVVVLYYVVLFLNRREAHTNDDLQRRRSRPGPAASVLGRTQAALAGAQAVVRRRLDKPATFD